MVHIVVSVN